MTNQDIIRTLREASVFLKTDFDRAELIKTENNKRSYRISDFSEYKRDLTEAARRINFLILEQAISPAELQSFLTDSPEPVVLFRVDKDSTIATDVFASVRGKVASLFSAAEFEMNDAWLRNSGGAIVALSILPYQGVVSEFQTDGNQRETMTPVRRLFRLFGTEKREIGFILIYALFIGLLSLVLPLGLQTTVELVSGGVFFSSVYLLIGLVIIGVLVTGVLQIVQISLVEYLQRRIFTKAALEFAFRIPRIKMEALSKSYAPELINRFFDVITVQKGLPKILLDLSSSAIQVFFGLLLLSLYHPFFVLFSLFLVSSVILIFYLTGSRGLHTSINESKYKYKVVQWLEELARTIKSFKLAGNTDLPFQRADLATSNYLKYRKAHFRVLLSQYSFFVFFKVAVTGGLLIMGTVLVVGREITLGQFVASEVIIILVLNAMEKIMLYIDVVYDMLTAVDKLAHVTDLPIEKTGGFDFPQTQEGKGYSIEASNLGYRYPDTSVRALEGINLSIAAGEKVCIAGPGSSGKSTLTNIISGLYTDFSGGVSINHYSLRDLDLTQLRDKVAQNISQEDLFDGTIYENVALGKPATTVEDVIQSLDRVGLKDEVNALPDGLNTHVVSGGAGLPGSFVHRLILARCLAKRPELVILNDFFSGLSKTDKLDLLKCVIDPKLKWTLVAVSNDPLVMASCDRVIVLDQGKVAAEDSYNSLLKQGVINKYFI